MINMMKKDKMANLLFRPGYNKLFHLTYRSYGTMDDVIKCSLHKLVFEINNTYALFKQEDSDYELSDGDILAIQNALLSGNYRFSPLRLVRGYGGSVDIEATLADEVVISALGAIIIQELATSSYFRKSCYSTYNKDKTLYHFFDTIQGWRSIEALIYLNCKDSCTKFSRSRLIEKVRPIVNNDDSIVKLISSFCNLPIVDNIGRDFSFNTGIPPLIYLGNILFNIFLDDIDQEIEERLPDLQYARFEHVLLIPIFHIDKEPYYCNALNEILNKYNFILPPFVRTVRGGSPINFAGAFIHLHHEGKCQIEFPKENH